MAKETSNTQGHATHKIAVIHASTYISSAACVQPATAVKCRIKRNNMLARSEIDESVAIGAMRSEAKRQVKEIESSTVSCVHLPQTNAFVAIERYIALDNIPALTSSNKRDWV